MKAKNKKRAFTLIEIIGAIVILGIIAIIAFATYTTSLRDFRENYYVREKKNLEKTAQEFFEDNRNYRPTRILNAQEVTLSTLETKEYTGNVVDYNGESCSNESYVIVVKEGTDDYSYHTCLICEKDGFDNTKDDKYCDKTWLDPTKVEFGLGPMNKAFIYKDSTKDELREELELPVSYVRKDDNGEIIAVKEGTKEENETILPINIDNVDTSTRGEYKVTYKYGDQEGERVVEVYENLAPTVVLEKENVVASALDGTTTTTKTTYTPGTWAQNVIVTLTAKQYIDENITTARFEWNLNGRWQEFCDTSPCTKKITQEMNQNVQFRVVDSKNHTGIPSNEARFKIDNTKPRCSLTIPTTIGSNGWYTQDVTIAFNEKIDQRTGNDDTLVSGIKQYNIQKSTESLLRNKTINSVVHTTDTAGVTYKGYVEDEAENFGICEITFKRDASSPKCINSGDSTTWTNSNRTITYGCNDTLAECDASYNGGSKTFTTTTKTSTIEAYTIKDKAGNTTTCAARTANVYVDKTAPGCTNSGDSTTWTNSNRTINYGCSDSDSGCASGNSGGSKAFSTTTKTSSIAAYTIKDNAGNSTTCAARTANVYVDKTAPSCTNSGDSTTWTSGNRTINYGCSDSDSGCASGNSGGSKAFSTTTKTSSIAAYTIKDNAGNSTTCAARTANVYVDKTAPSCTNSGDSTTWTASDRTINYGCSDSDSGCASGNSGGSKAFNTTTKTSSIAAYTIKDNAGNSTTCAARTANVYVDKSNPTCSVTKSNTGATSGVTTTVTCSDSGSGVKTCPSGDTGLKANKTYTVTDNLGKTGTCSVTVSSQNQTRSKSCSAGSSCQSAGCQTYNSCPTSACGVNTYQECVNSACGVATYNRCSAAGCETYKTCSICTEWQAKYTCTKNNGTSTTKYGGTGSSQSAATNYCSGYNSGCCSTSSGGCKSFSCSGVCKTYSNVADSSCGCSLYKRASTCGVAAYKSCRIAACGVDTYKSCETADCGCKTYKTNTATCGCSTWGSFGSWTNTTSCSAGESSNHSTTTECRTIYN